MRSLQFGSATRLWLCSCAVAFVCVTLPATLDAGGSGSSRRAGPCRARVATIAAARGLDVEPM